MNTNAGERGFIFARAAGLRLARRITVLLVVIGGFLGLLQALLSGTVDGAIATGVAASVVGGLVVAVFAATAS